MIPVDDTILSSNTRKMKNFAEHIDIDMDTSLEGSVDMSLGEDSTREKRDNAKKSTSHRRGRDASEHGVVPRRKPPQRMKSRSLSPDKRKERPLMRSKSRSLSPDRIRKRTVDFDVDASMSNDRPTITKVPSSRRVMRSSSGSRRKLLGEMSSSSSSARPPSTRRLTEKSPSRRKLMNDLNDSSSSFRRKAMTKTPSSRRLKENKSGNVEGLRRSLHDTEKPPSTRNLRKTQSFKLAKTPSSRRLQDNSNRNHEQAPKLQKTSSRRNLLVENGKKTSSQKLKENVSFQHDTDNNTNNSKLLKSSSRRNLMADKPSTTRDKQPPTTRKTSRSRKSHSVDPQARPTDKKMVPRTVSRSLSPEAKTRRKHHPRGTGTNKLRKSKTNEQKSILNDTPTTPRPRLRETMTQFDTTTDVAVGRKRHQQRRKTVTANLEALVQKHTDCILQFNTDTSLEEVDRAATLPEQVEEDYHHHHHHHLLLLEGEKKNSEWTRAKKVLTKMTKKIIGKQAEMLFFPPQDAYGAVGEGLSHTQRRRHSASEEENNNNPALVTAS